MELLEENSVTGVELLRIGYPETPIQQGEQSELRVILELDAKGIAKSIQNFISDK